MERLVLCLTLLALAGTLCLAAPSRLYVSPEGKDTNPGTADKPLRTLPAAQQAVRALKATATGPIEVLLKAGTYRLEAPLSFTPEDSGTAPAPITWP